MLHALVPTALTFCSYLSSIVNHGKGRHVPKNCHPVGGDRWWTKSPASMHEAGISNALWSDLQL
jgi:hypothetical protein